MLFSLEWWMDPKQRDRQSEIQGVREQDDDDGEGDDPPPAYSLAPPPQRGEARAAYLCRVCGAEAQEKTFCLHCLADTMVPAP